MKVAKYQFDANSMRIDICAENHGEGALLTHFHEGHIAILCSGDFEATPQTKRRGLGVFIRNKPEFQIYNEREDELGRKGKLERRRRRKKR